MIGRCLRMIGSDSAWFGGIIAGDCRTPGAELRAVAVFVGKIARGGRTAYSQATIYSDYSRTAGSR